MGAVQVAVFQAVALPDERQRLLGIQRLASGGEVGSRIRVVHGVLQAHVDAAQALGQVVKPARLTSAK